MESLMNPRHVSRSLISALAFVAAAQCHAAIMGFGDFSSFTTTQLDNRAAPQVSIAAGVGSSIELTGLQQKELRSIFHKVPQPVARFSASFTYQASGTFGGGRQQDVAGAAFVLHNDGRGAAAIGIAESHDQLGYQGIANSAAVTLEIHGGASDPRAGFYTGGEVGGGAASTSPVSLYSGRPILVSLNYNGSILQVQLRDSQTGDAFSTAYAVNLPAMVGGSTAYVGFTASTGDDDLVTQHLSQEISDFQFTPEPSALALCAMGAMPLVGMARKRFGRFAG
jgi:hypothetical protein